MQYLLARILSYRPRPGRMILPAFALLLALAVACGSAAAPVEPQGATDAVPQADGAGSQDTAGSGGAPTAVPTPASPAEVASTEVHPGKVTWLVGSFANERMTYCLAGGGGHDYGRQIHAFLISTGVQDGAKVLVPGVATKWESSPDGRTWTLTIRDGVKFHDGSELTAEDVLWTLRWAIGPQAAEYSTGGGCLTQSQLTENIEQTGPNQVSVTYKETFPTFVEQFSESTSTWIGTVYPAGLGEGPSVLHDEAVEAAFDRNPIGAGIFKLVNHTAAESMEFERFDDHYYQPANGLPEDRRPRFTTLDLRLVPEPATRVAALRAGEADVAPVTLGAKEQIEAGGGRIIWGEEGVYFYARLLGCWEENIPCHDIRVRQALNYTVNREAMRDRLFGGPEVMQVKGFTSVTPSTIGYVPELDPFPFDPEKGRQLLAEAGYPNGEGFGTLIINTWPSTAMPNMPAAAQYVAEVWSKELGIDTEVNVGEEASIKELTRLTEEAYGQVLFRDNETRLDAASMLNGTWGRNPDRPDRASRVPEVVAIAEKTRVIVDPEERVPALTEAYLRFREESNDISMGYVNIPWGVGPRIVTWEPYPMAFYPTALHTITLAE